MSEKIIKALLERVEVLERQNRNLIRVGNVVRVEGRQCVIDYEPDSDNDYYSPLIPFVPEFAGDVLQWRAPTVGEQMIVLNLSGGLTESNAIAISSMYCAAFQPDHTNPLKTYTRFLDVFRAETDSEGNHTITLKGNLTIAGKKSFIVAVDGDVSIKPKGKANFISGGKTAIDASFISIGEGEV